MAKMRTLTLIALLFAAMGIASAETLKMKGTSAMSSDDGRPSRGMTQTSVQSKYGSPASTRAPVGDPPISRWEYANFIVYFEYDKVVHTVLKR